LQAYPFKNVGPIISTTFWNFTDHITKHAVHSQMPYWYDFCRNCPTNCRPSSRVFYSFSVWSDILVQYIFHMSASKRHMSALWLSNLQARCSITMSFALHSSGKRMTPIWYSITYFYLLCSYISSHFQQFKNPLRGEIHGAVFSVYISRQKTGISRPCVAHTVLTWNPDSTRCPWLRWLSLLGRGTLSLVSSIAGDNNTWSCVSL
jgi:hypothetical protein